MKKEVFIGLTYGDPAGIGPEILRKVLKNWKYSYTPYVIGAKDYFKKFKIPYNKRNKIQLHPLAESKFDFKPGYPSNITGKHAYECLKLSAKLALSKKINALITNPVSKEAISKANINFLGQTDELAKFCKVNPEKVIMLFAANDLKLALFTRHVSLKDVPRKINQKKLYEFLITLNKELKKWFKIKNPKIAVLGLNPHAGENGLFGKEEEKIISPVIKKLKKSGL